MKQSWAIPTHNNWILERITNFWVWVCRPWISHAGQNANLAFTFDEYRTKCTRFCHENDLYMTETTDSLCEASSGFSDKTTQPTLSVVCKTILIGLNLFIPSKRCLPEETNQSGSCFNFTVLGASLNALSCAQCSKGKDFLQISR